MTIQQHYWSAIPEILAYVASLANGRVLEIGPGAVPFAKATDFVDWTPQPGQPAQQLDINVDRLPYEDKTFDFVYCRHVIEDIYNPPHALSEMGRVAKAGYIETPSPLAECAKDMDHGSPPWRGYHHHRYVCWVEGSILTLTPKYPMIEYVSFNDDELHRRLNSGPLLWNSYYLWEGAPQWRLLSHKKDYRVETDYGGVLSRAAQAALENAREFLGLLREGT